MGRRIVFGAKDLRIPAGVESRLARHGWSLVTANGPDAARVVARETRPAIVVLPAEAGMLACAKIARELPRTRVVVVGPADAKLERYARFAGAAVYVTDTATPEQFLGAVTDGQVVAC